jgi:hypothetical protein
MVENPESTTSNVAPNAVNPLTGESANTQETTEPKKGSFASFRDALKDILPKGIMDMLENIFGDSKSTAAAPETPSTSPTTPTTQVNGERPMTPEAQAQGAVREPLWGNGQDPLPTTPVVSASNGKEPLWGNGQDPLPTTPVALASNGKEPLWGNDQDPLPTTPVAPASNRQPVREGELQERNVGKILDGFTPASGITFSPAESIAPSSSPVRTQEQGGQALW